MPDFLVSISDWIVSTQVLAQIKEVDADGLFHNTYFLVPFICFIIYNLYRQAFNNLVTMALGIGLWYFSGTDYVRGAIVSDQIQLGRVLPIVGVGVAAIAVMIYLIFIRQD